MESYSWFNMYVNAAVITAKIRQQFVAMGTLISYHGDVSEKEFFKVKNEMNWNKKEIKYRLYANAQNGFSFLS